MGKSTKAEIMKDEGVKVVLGNVNEPKKVKLADGKEYEIKFDLNSLCSLQEKFGEDVFTALSGIDGSDFKLIRTILFVVLEHEGLTEKEVGSLIDMSNMPSVVEALGQALENSTPETEDTQTESGK
ncbi:hypothetical protein MKX79_14885 [Viridibacillus sp. FSL R5-0468]|uniref:hypothetical protein n=1 Tax=Viridibacillus sp. FSL R5-0468 TaxID=2921640 RepID=UPI0030FCEC0D